MLRPVVVHVAPLAEGGEVRVHVVAGVVIAVGGRQYHPGRSGAGQFLYAWQRLGRPPLPVPPGAHLSIPPAAIVEAVDALPMRALAALAAAPCSAEPDHGRELRPVDEVEKAVLSPDRH